MMMDDEKQRRCQVGRYFDEPRTHREYKRESGGDE